MQRWQPLRDAALVAALLVAAWAATYVAGGSRTALPHAFYLAVVLAGARLGRRAGAVAGVAAGLACGPLMPLNVAVGSAQPVANWLVRLAFFVAVGLLAGHVTERLRRAVARERALAEERADLASARSTLLQVVSHELRTPLTVIKGCLESLGPPDALPPRARLLLPPAGRGLARLEDLAEVVVAAVDPDPEERRTTDVAIGQLLADAVGSVGAGLDRERVRIHAPEGQVVATQPEALRLVVRCLVENALKFAPEGAVEVAARPSSGGVLIEVRDRGPGIPDAFTTGEFRMMQQGDTSTTRAHGGLGLGLYAARRLVERLGGELVVERAEGGGTRAAVLLPGHPPLEAVRQA